MVDLQACFHVRLLWWDQAFLNRGQVDAFKLQKQSLVRIDERDAHQHGRDVQNDQG